ncbi:sensor histidine kinase [Paractinoplanes rishiriensis]|uniref:Histidine kinase n=1 Tax=Paractinoplanes rishiriensis TaxID=1050105 RepID=A0A919MNQ5_9ACTN|nr:histidine kinase [Actinoplanes rishiriensis]GIE94281.1 histidine kinase [Actinoplanes rishiriensis]
MFRWWRERSQAARFDLSVRGSFYLNFGIVVALATVSLMSDLGDGTWLVLLLFAAQAVCCTLLVRAGLDHHAGRRSRPVVLAVVAVAVTAAGVLAAYLAYPDADPDRQDGPANAILVILGGCLVAALTTAVRSYVTVATGLALCATAYGISAAQGVRNIPGLLAFGFMLLVVGLACRVTTWMLDVVWELDRARQVQAGLAVAEERLRFARDLHDVVGRTLSVIALKSELAAQLARRGRDSAIDEMLEVRRIAQESLDELRAVVGGYRAADLDSELAGARSLLASAGIECRMIGDGSGLPAEVQGTLGWAVREGTTNVLRHSDARTCTITLRGAAAGEVTLTMDNDGVRAPAPAAGSRVRFGSGLVGLAERLAALGGTATAERHGKDSFRLTITLSAAPAAASRSAAPPAPAPPLTIPAATATAPEPPISAGDVAGEREPA